MKPRLASYKFKFKKSTDGVTWGRDTVIHCESWPEYTEFRPERCLFEHRSQPLLPRRLFFRRVAQSAAMAAAVIVVSLIIGMTGYHALEGLTWIDSFLNAAMLLGGMGPVKNPVTFAGKVFAGTYALYCGLVVILVAGVLLAPVLHRLLHRLHLEGGHA